MREFTEDDLLSLELQVKKEGVLDRQAALDLIEAHRDALQEVDELQKADTSLAAEEYDRGHKDGYDEGYEAGRGDRLGPG